MALQCLLNVCDKYALSAELKYNTKNTFCMCVRPKWIKDLQPLCITLNGMQLKFVNEHCYLGVIMTSNMSDVADMQRQIKAIYTRGNGIIKHFRHCSEMSKQSYLILTVLVFMVVFYGLIIL